MKNLVVLSGAGISAESGLKTFRDSGGLWEGYNVMDVATPEAWRKNPDLVQEFYNMRRKEALKAEPNEGHKALAELEKTYNVTVITQNVDNLHEKAGSSKVIHLHGELSKARSTFNPSLVYEINGWEIKMGDKCEKGSQLRPHIVWFGEAVPMMDEAITVTETADIFIVVGTSLQVYPAAGLLDYVQSETMVYLVDPVIPNISTSRKIHFIAEKASTGLQKLAKELLTLSI